MMRDGDGSKKASINSHKKAKMGGRGTGRGRDIEWGGQGSGGYSNL